MPIAIENLILEQTSLHLASVPLSTHEMLCLASSVHLFKNKMELKQIYYWGRVNGTENDYHVIVAGEKSIVGQKAYYFSTDFENWRELPVDGVRKTIPAHQRFIGDPDFVARIPVISSKDSEPGDSLEVESFPDYFEIEIRSVREIERLADFVAQIDREVDAAPRGAFIKEPKGDLVPNKYFLGLSPEKALRSSEYVLVGSEKEVVCGGGFVSFDSMKSLAEDEIEEKWAISRVPFTKMVLVKNLRWTGFVLFSVIGENRFGSIYVGDGLCCSAFAFSRQK